MTRLSVTVDHEISEGLEMLPGVLSYLQPRLADEGFFPAVVYERPRIGRDLVQSLRDLGNDPSQASIVRGALRCYLHLVSEMQKTAALEAGYSALAADEERADALRAAVTRAAPAWVGES